MSTPNGLQRSGARDGAASDLHLVERLAASDLAAAGELYDRYAPLVLALARRILRNDEDAEDVVQEVFSQIWRSAARFESRRGSVGAWVTMMARSRAIDRLRARAGRPDQASSVQDPDGMPSTAPGPSDHLLREERAVHVREALLALPGPQRTALELAYFEGLSQSEIAHRLAEPLGTVKTRIRTALQTLRERLHA
jgi:RNA polymerase sigma-70 factor (ECF subfamily)